MTTDKVRIYELAKELGTPNKVLIEVLKDKMNVSVKSHSSSISVEQAKKVRTIFENGNGKASKSSSQELVQEKSSKSSQSEEPAIKQEAESPKQKPNTETFTNKNKTESTMTNKQAEMPLNKREKPTHTKKEGQSVESSSASGGQRQKPTGKKTESGSSLGLPYKITGNKYRKRPDSKKEGEAPQSIRRKKPTYVNKSTVKPGAN
jgi:translation initiation factor IF-2